MSSELSSENQEKNELNENRREQLIALGCLAGEVAHDLNNLLTGILGHVSYLRHFRETGENPEVSIAAIEKAAKSAATMTQRILQFSKNEEGKFEVLNLSELVKSGTLLLEAALPKNIEVELVGIDKEILINGESVSISLALLNLIINARDALPNGGLIRIVLETSHNENSQGEGWAVLKVVDNGEGIAKEKKEKIFEPYFTTKESKGTGLGLATVCSVVEKHLGQLELNSELGLGSEFILSFPLVRKAQEKVIPPQKIEGGTEKILLVDDEDSVRMVVEKSLEMLGYDVDSAADGEEALVKFKENGGNYSLVILDMMMPKMAGDEVFLRLKDINPSTSVLIASGYASDNKTKNILENGGKGFIQKPFAIEDLALEVRRCLAQDLIV